ncbi:hypothetical protein RhiLY_00382 [Ceratobasidium sp. AG-Ba]|nr:hypothetical protein RhiLY_00382 [Ceratobasidium sp. AG-Ba]
MTSKAVPYGCTSATIELPGIQLRGGFLCAGNGLVWKKHTRMKLSDVVKRITESSQSAKRKGRKPAQDDLVVTKDWMQAQCKFYGLPYGHNQTEDQMKQALNLKLAQGGDISPALKLLEDEANKQFLAAVKELQSYADQYCFASLPVDPLPPKRKRSDTTAENHSRTKTSASDNARDIQIAQPLQATHAAAVSEITHLQDLSIGVTEPENSLRDDHVQEDDETGIGCEEEVTVPSTIDTSGTPFAH